MLTSTDLLDELPIVHYTKSPEPSPALPSASVSRADTHHRANGRPSISDASATPPSITPRRAVSAARQNTLAVPAPPARPPAGDPDIPGKEKDPYQDVGGFEVLASLRLERV